jgi:hypothetical protein
LEVHDIAYQLPDLLCYGLVVLGLLFLFVLLGNLLDLHILLDLYFSLLDLHFRFLHNLLLYLLRFLIRLGS